MAALNDDAGLYHDARSLLESRAAPLGRALLLAVIAVIVVAFGWMAWAQVEEIVVASGRVEPAGKVKLVNHARGGRIAQLMVRNGDLVEQGAPLLRLDPDVREGEHAELLGRFQVKAVEVARLTAEAHGGPLLVEPELAKARPDLVAAETRLREARATALAARRETLQRAVQAKRGELRTASVELGRVKGSLTLLRQQLEAVKELSDRGLYPKLKLVSMERQVKDGEGEMGKAEASFGTAQASLAESESRLQTLDRDWQSEVLADLNRATAERDRLAEQLQSHANLLESLVVRAPVAGIVHDLAVNGIGQSVAANQTLLRLVPLGEGLVVEARVANADIGRLREGLPATVKVRAFDWLRHGTLPGRVAKVAADTSTDLQAGVDSRTRESSYVVTVVTERNRLGSEPGRLELGPGMVVDVEVRVGERTILSYLTDQIWRRREQAFRQG